MGESAGAVTKPHRPGSLTEMNFLTARRLEVRGPGVGRAGACRGRSLGLRTAVFSLCPHVIVPLCACVLIYRLRALYRVRAHPSDLILP